MISLIRDYIYRMVTIFRFDHKIAENQQLLLKFIQPKSIHLSTRLWGINPANYIIPQSLELGSILLG